MRTTAKTKGEMEHQRTFKSIPLPAAWPNRGHLNARQSPSNFHMNCCAPVTFLLIIVFPSERPHAAVLVIPSVAACHPRRRSASPRNRLRCRPLLLCDSAGHLEKAASSLDAFPRVRALCEGGDAPVCCAWFPRHRGR